MSRSNYIDPANLTRGQRIFLSYFARPEGRSVIGIAAAGSGTSEYRWLQGMKTAGLLVIERDTEIVSSNTGDAHGALGRSRPLIARLTDAGRLALSRPKREKTTEEG